VQVFNPGANSLACPIALLICLSAAAQDVQVNSKDNNSSTLGNETSESETYVARSGSLAVVEFNTSRQAGILGLGSFNSLSGYAYSTNSGASFTDGGFVPAGSYQLLGDPTVAFDNSGNLYYGSLLEEPSSGDSFGGVSKATDLARCNFRSPGGDLRRVFNQPRSV
jgi:hypothetical protein